MIGGYCKAVADAVPAVITRDKLEAEYIPKMVIWCKELTLLQLRGHCIDDGLGLDLQRPETAA